MSCRLSRLVTGGLTVAGLVGAVAGDSANAYDAVLAWRPAAAPAGYNLYVRHDQEPQGAPIDVGSPQPDADSLMRFLVSGLPLGPTSHFLVASYDLEGNERGWSSELSINYAMAKIAATKAEIDCRKGMVAGGSKLALTTGLTLAACHKKRLHGKLPATTNCSAIVDADPNGKIRRAQAKVRKAAVAKCTGVQSANVGNAECPTPCETAVVSIADFADVANCLTCLMPWAVQAMSSSTQGNPALPLGRPEQTCHTAIGRAQRKHMATVLKERRKCQERSRNGVLGPSFVCPDTSHKSRIGKARRRGEAMIDRACSEVNIGVIDSCAEGTLHALKTCVFDASEATGAAVFNDLSRISAIDSGG